MCQSLPEIRGDRSCVFVYMRACAYDTLQYYGLRWWLVTYGLMNTKRYVRNY